MEQVGRRSKRDVAPCSAWRRAAFACFAALAAFGWAGATWAANVDLYIDARSDKGIYAPDEVQIHNLVVGNRGPGAATNASFTLTIPNLLTTSQAWNQTVICVPSGGAVCPGSYGFASTSNNVLQATIPSLPVGGAINLTVRAPGYPASFAYGALNVTTSVSAGPGDADLSGGTNASNTWIYITTPTASFGTAVTGTASVSAPGNATASYAVVINNLGDVANSISSTLTLSPSQGTGSASTVPYLDGPRFVSIVCTGATGGASCANVKALQRVTFDLLLQSPQPAALADGSGNPQYIGGLNMPGNSSLTLSVTVATGTSLCSDSLTTDHRNLTVQSVVAEMTSALGGVFETVASPADNQAAQVTTIGAQACAKGDLLVNSIVQSPGIAPVGPNAPFAYTVTYSNSIASQDPVTNVPLRFTAVWPVGASPAVMNAAATSCVASGGAVCPTAYSASGNSVTATAPSMPTNSQLQITFSGTSGGDDTRLCQPLVLFARATITPPPGAYADTNYNPQSIPDFTTGTPTQGNNANQTQTQANVGVPCGPSYDLSTEKSGPFSDYAATIPVTVAQPGQYLYFRHKVRLLAPSTPLVNYVISDNLTYYSNVGRTLGNNNNPSATGMSFDGIGSFTNRVKFAARPGDPPGLPVPAGYVQFNLPVTPFDTGVRCSATGGAVCPDSIVSSGSSGGGGGYLYMGGWQANWSGGKPVFPSGGELEFIATYRVPPVANGASTCSTGAARPYPRNAISASGSPDPAGSDRATANDSARVDFDIDIVNCVGTLSVTKTAVEAAIPLNGIVHYQIVLTNTSASALDMPQLVDGSFPSTPASIACTATSGGAVCPAFTPLPGVKYRDNGATTSALTVNDNVVSNIRSDFDFSWGTVGSNTMPPGSSVTFTVTLQHPSSATSSRNFVHAKSDAGNPIPFPTVSANASINVPTTPALAISKSVSPPNPIPGSLVTYTVSLRNPTAGSVSNVLFNDTMPAGFAAANPAGYGNVSCQALTLADGMLAASPAPTAIACPVFSNTAAGISATIASLPANSGLRIRYTAIAPASFQTVPNVAELRASGVQRSSGDATSQANVAVQALGQPAEPIAVPATDRWALLLLAALVGLLGWRLRPR